MTLYCGLCSQRISAEELCRHPDPLCDGCCDTEHGGGDEADVDWDAA